MTTVRILEHRVKFFDSRPEEVNNVRDEKAYKNWCAGKGAAGVVVQATSQQETIVFKVEGAPVKGFTRTNKTSKFFVTVSTEDVVIGDFDVGEHEYTFAKQDIEDIAVARAKWSLETTFHAGGKTFCKRSSTFEIVAPRP